MTAKKREASNQQPRKLTGDEQMLVASLKDSLAEIIDLSQIKGEWSCFPRERVAEVSSRAKWLLRALRKLLIEIGAEEGSIDDLIRRPNEMTDEELDAFCERM